MSKAPKLRFKEFSGDWEKKKIGEITTKVGSGKTPKGGNSVYTDSGVIFLRSQNVLNGKLNLSDVAYITEEINSTMKSTEVYGDDILLNITGASIGRSCNVPKNFPKANVNQHVCIIRLNEHYNSNFIMNQIISEKVQRQIDSYQAGGNREGLNFEQIKSIKVDSTCIEEQEKIASFFSLIDDKISLQGEKVEALKDYKRGMMQKIFSRELRFKDDEGRDYPEWEEKKLESIVSKKKKGKNAIYAESGNILLNNEYMENNTEPMYVENEIDVNEEDILILWDGSQAGKMYTGFKGVLGSTFVAITLDKHNCNRFIHQQLMYNLDKIQLVWREGSGVPHVAKDFIENFKIKVPKLEEQRKISKLLEGIDSKLKKEQEKLDSLNEYKKGLLQQMFV